MPHRFQTPETCPVCGATVPRGARACAECGADERTGWDEETTRYDGLDLPAEAFDDEEARHDAGSNSPRRPAGGSFFWWLVGLVLLAATIALVVRSGL